MVAINAAWSGRYSTDYYSRSVVWANFQVLATIAFYLCRMRLASDYPRLDFSSVTLDLAGLFKPLSSDGGCVGRIGIKLLSDFSLIHPRTSVTRCSSDETYPARFWASNNPVFSMSSLL